jgi:16S rRNA (cytosine967-C5)-methyltransferase
MQFDRILVDAPCSNTGVMRRRVDVRWRLEPWFFAEMTKQQTLILENILPLLKPGGTLVYSTCSVDREENEGLVEALLKNHRNLKLVESEATLPWRDQLDGAFAAKLVKK